MDLNNSGNVGYLGEIYLGSEDNPQKIRALFDTGSANSWILSKEAVSFSKRDKHNFYDKDQSLTIDEPDEFDQNWVKIYFGGGSLQGYFVHDRCTLGDIHDTSHQLVFDDYMFGLVVQQNVFNSSLDAIIGLAYPEFAEPGVVPFFDGMMQADIL